MYTHACTFICTYIYLFIYIYMHRDFGWSQCCIQVLDPLRNPHRFWRHKFCYQSPLHIVALGGVYLYSAPLPRFAPSKLRPLLNLPGTGETGVNVHANLERPTPTTRTPRLCSSCCHIEHDAPLDLSDMRLQPPCKPLVLRLVFPGYGQSCGCNSSRVHSIKITEATSLGQILAFTTRSGGQ